MGKTARKTKAREEVTVAETEASTVRTVLAQLVLPLAELVRGDLRELVHTLGMQAIASMLEQERTELCGERYKHSKERQATRGGSTAGRLTLTVMGLGLSPTLERSFATTNPIENFNGNARHLARRVKRWRGGLILRWVGAAVAEAEAGFRRLKGHRDMFSLVASLRKYDEMNPTSRREFDDRRTPPDDERAAAQFQQMAGHSLRLDRRGPGLPRGRPLLARRGRLGARRLAQLDAVAARGSI